MPQHITLSEHIAASLATVYEPEQVVVLIHDEFVMGKYRPIDVWIYMRHEFGREAQVHATLAGTESWTYISNRAIQVVGIALGKSEQ